MIEIPDRVVEDLREADRALREDDEPRADLATLEALSLVFRALDPDSTPAERLNAKRALRRLVASGR